MLTKRVNDILDFDFDFTAWLMDRGGDNIVSYSVTATGLDVGAVSLSGGVVKAFISGGSKDVLNSVVCKIVTAGGRTKEVESTIVVTN